MVELVELVELAVSPKFESVYAQQSELAKTNRCITRVCHNSIEYFLGAEIEQSKPLEVKLNGKLFNSTDSTKPKEFD